MEYEEFLRRKELADEPAGFEPPKRLNGKLFPFQRDIVRWALRRGKAAVFADCGLGKTPVQLEWARIVRRKTGGNVLVLAPLAVSGQTVREADKFGIKDVRYRRSQGEVTGGVTVTNYEMLDRFDPGRFAGVVLDESSILKNYTGVTKRRLVEAFSATPYRLACTATPSPNDHLELGNHAEFLGVMPSNEMIMRWFVNDTMVAGGYRLKGHAEADFWRWVSSWAVSLSKPSDLGYSDDGFKLPGLEVVPHVVGVDHKRAWAGGDLFVCQSLNATQMWAEKRATLEARVSVAVELVRKAKGHVVVWCDTNQEADELRARIGDCVEVRGSHSLKVKEERLGAFSAGDVRVIVTKADIAGFGINWQHAPTQVFVGLTYSFEKFYQALRRSYRYGQKRVVRAHVIYAESEGNIVESLERKRMAHEELQVKMNESVKKYGLGIRGDRASDKATEREFRSGDGWAMFLGDCVEETKQLGGESVDYTIFSPPFSNLYVYTDSYADMGNSSGHGEFFEHFGFLAAGLLRATKNGRLCSIHCKDLPLFKNRDGAAGLYDFPGGLVKSMETAGWTFHSRCTIWKDPVLEMQRTKNHGLLHKNFAKRREVTRMGMAEYVLTFRKNEGEVPDCLVDSPAMPGDYIGGDPPERWDSQRDYSIQTWQKYASPIWMDIRQTNVLNVRSAREDKDEKHLCPLQLDVIERCVWLWTNPGDVVYSPFAGVGSEGYVAVKMGRQFVGVELKRAYFEKACEYLGETATQMALFA